jgi:hypothetical protein
MDVQADPNPHLLYMYICALLLLHTCPPTATHVSSYCYTCVLILLHVSSYGYTFVRIFTRWIFDLQADLNAHLLPLFFRANIRPVWRLRGHGKWPRMPPP